MADKDIKRNVENDEMSASELVNMLKDSISSADVSQNAPEDEPAKKTISKKGIDPSKDIASMLKKFMPEVDASAVDTSADFELDETDPQEAQTSEFELVGEDIPTVRDTTREPDYELEGYEPLESSSPARSDPSENLAAFDAESIDVDDISFSLDDIESDFEEPTPPPAKKRAKEKKPKKKRLGFGKGHSLADGYAKMLENEMNFDTAEAPMPMAEASVEPEHFGGAETPSAETDAFYTEVAPAASDVAPAPEYVPEEPQFTPEVAPEFMPEPEFTSYESIAESEMPDISEYASERRDTDTARADAEVNAEVNAEAPNEPQLYMINDEVKPQEKEEDYFIDTKKPLVFDDEDETPIVPDATAFGAEPDNMQNAPYILDAQGTFDDAEQTAELYDGGTSEDLNDKDINLMVALGYEDELEKTIGKENVDRITDDISSEITDFIDIDDAYAFDGFELETPERFRKIGNRYKEEHKTMKLRVIGTSIFTLALLIFELLAMFDVTLGGALNIHHYPVVGIMLSLQLLVLSCALSWRRIASGLLGIVTFNPTPASIPAATVLMTFIYNIIMALIAPNTGLELYNFPASLNLLFLTLNDYFDLSREIRAFNTIATRKAKYAVLPNVSAEKSADEEISRIFDEDASVAEEKHFEVKKLDFIDNYFRRSNIASKKDRRLNLVIYPFIALAVALGVISYVTNRSAVTAFNISILTVLFCTPMSMLFLKSYPFFGAVKKAFKNDSTIIGERSVEEYSYATTVSFSDSDVFPTDMTVTRGIKLYDNNAIYDVLYNLAGIYSKIGGPLKSRLEQATAEMGHSEDVEITRIEDKGIEAIVDGKNHILAGQSAFMMANGISAAYDADDEKMMNEGCSIMFLVINGVLSAKLYVCYDIDHDFEAVIDTLAEEGTETVISTADPNIDSELLASRLSISRYPARIVKRQTDGGRAERAESGIVSRSSLRSLAGTILLCNKIGRVRKNSKVAGILSMSIGIIVMIFLSLFSSKLQLHSVYVALYQIFWMIPLFLFTKLYVK